MLRSNIAAGVLWAASAAVLTGVGAWVSGGFDPASPDPPSYEGGGEASASRVGPRMAGSPPIAGAPSSAPGGGPMLTPEFTIRKTIPEVQLQFSVADEKGRLVQNLAPADVRIFDDQAPVGQFQRFERIDDLPLRIGLVLDVSGSMRKVMAQEKSVALAFLKEVLRPQTDRAFVLAFGSTVELWQDTTGDAANLQGAIQRVAAPSAGTDMYDALYSACVDHWNAEETEPVHRVIVVVTDGDDTGSRHGLQDVVAAAQRSAVQIYALTVHSPRKSYIGDGILQRLADESGGRFFVAPSNQEVPAIFEQIEQELRSQYYVSFRPARETPGFHALQVEVRAPQPLQVHARQGYYVAQH